MRRKHLVYKYFDFSDNEGGNPMVAGFQDDLDSDDDVQLSKTSTKPSLPAIPSQDIDLSSDNEDNIDNKDNDIQARPVIQSDLDLDSDADSRIPNYNEPPKQRTPLNVQLSSGKECSLKTMTEDTEKKASDTKGLSFSAVVNEPDSEESNDEQNGNPAVTVLADEDISDDDTTSSKPVDSGLATDTTQVMYRLGSCSPLKFRLSHYYHRENIIFSRAVSKERSDPSSMLFFFAYVRLLDYLDQTLNKSGIIVTFL